MKMDRPNLNQSSLATDWDVERQGRQFGSTAKRRNLVKQFAQTSTVHGTAYVFQNGRNSSTCVKIFYRILLAACFVFVVYNVTILLMEYFGKHSTVINTIDRDAEIGLEDDPDWFPRYPRITICRKPFYRTDYNDSYLQLVEYAMLSLGHPYMPLSRLQMSYLIHIVMYKSGYASYLPAEARLFRNGLRELTEQYWELQDENNFDLKQFVYDHSLNCSEFFVSCLVVFYYVDCCQIFEPIITNNGVCFVILIEEVNSFIGSGDVTFAFDLTTPKSVAQHKEWGFRLFLTNPNEEKPSRLSWEDGVDVYPEDSTTVQTQLVKKQRSALHSPWHGLWDNCPRYQHNDTYSSDRYSSKMCEIASYKLILEKYCQCQYIIFESGSSNLRYCDPKDLYDCFFRNSINETVTDMEDACQNPCITYYFKTQSSFTSLGGNNLTRLTILHKGSEYTYHEYSKTTIISLLSQIGGSLGLYLGASIITLFEIVFFTASWIWYRLVPDTTKVHHQPPRRRH